MFLFLLTTAIFVALPVHLESLLGMYVHNFCTCVMMVFRKLSKLAGRQGIVGIRLSRETMVSALVGSQSCSEQRLEWLSNPILA